ncbi:MAG TPA: hypothetical protein PKE66_09565, partial [Pyrinomonadaceae bacterium]|nr:hypothetical protein [Pyrinomonadaceae bacterium]
MSLAGPGCTDRWDDRFDRPGASGTVSVIVNGPNGSLYVGLFSGTAGGTGSRIVKWNGTSWEPMGGGMNGPVNAIAVAPNGDVYAGGSFTMAGTTPANSIARWNGTEWFALGSGTNGGGTLDAVNAVAVASNGDVYIGGPFTQVGGNPAEGFARWNGSSWFATGDGVVVVEVRTLIPAPQGGVFVGGIFINNTTGMPPSGVARWTGSSWVELGSGIEGPSGGIPISMALSSNGDLIVGGNFTSAGGSPANYIARWNGASWLTLGTGIGGVVWGVGAAPNGDIYAVGQFSEAGGQPAGGVARWNGSSWSSIATGSQLGGRAVAVLPNGDVYVGGTFNTFDSQPINNIVRRVGTQWRALSEGITGGSTNIVRVAPDGRIVVGGSFLQGGSTPGTGIPRLEGGYL